MKTKKQVEKEIAALKAIKPRVRRYSMFGDDNHLKIDAQIQVLEERMDEDKIYQMFEGAYGSDAVLESALHAGSWLQGEVKEGLADDWPVAGKS